MKTLIKFVLAIFFTVCLFKMPYNYYQAVRFISLIGFAALIYLDIKDRFYFFLPIAIAGLIIFNPIYPFTFKREIWQQIDKGLAVILMGWGVFEILKKSKTNVGKT